MTRLIIKYFFFSLLLFSNLYSQTEIKNIYYNHDRADSTFLYYNFNSLIGIAFSPEVIEGSISTALDYYENNGYPFTLIKVESIYFSTDTLNQKKWVDIYLNIDKGILCRIDKIEIEGNTKTKDRVIIRELRNLQEKFYNQSAIDKIPEQLNRLRFFEPLEKPDFFLNNHNEGVLKISVKEKETNNFDGVVGYVPGNGNEKGFFTGYVNISLRNLFGTGRSAAVRWLQENKSSQELELRYLEPWLFGLPFNIEAGLHQRKQDSTYVQRSIEGKLEFLATEEISSSFLINSLSTIPTERQNKVFTVFNSSSLSTGINLKIDTRNDLYAPTEGIILINAYKYTNKIINGPNEYITPATKTRNNFQHIEIDFGFYKEIFSEQIIALDLHARELKGTDIEISDLYLLGGTNTLRGYREKQFSGNRILWSNLEYRYLLTRRSFAFLFFDAGYFLRNENKNITKLDGFKIGYGLGLNIETSLGVLGVSFALAKGDSFSDGKIHFGIVNEF